MPICLAVALLIVARAIPAQTAQLQTFVDATEAKRRVALSINSYHARVRVLWLQSERKRLGNLSEARKQALFGPYVHCHARETDPRFVMPVLSAYMPIAVNSAYALCPSWMLADTPETVLAAASGGLYLDRLQSDSLRPASDSLYALLKLAVANAPSDAWLLGQFIRHLVNERRFDVALGALDECGADAWFCEALGGYVEHARGNAPIAERRFGRALDAMPADVRCTLLDIGAILPFAIREQYEPLSCEQRAVLAERYFWLADPRWTETGNERRTEHVARKVALILATSNKNDARYNWEYTQGGATVGEMLQRYGWPSLTTWIGVQTDTGHSNYLVTRSATPNSPYSTAEYHGARVAFGAPSLLFADETFAADAAWQLVPPPGTVADHRRKADEVWWPFEHMSFRDYLVAQFTDWQMVTFRRERDNLLAVAVTLGTTSPMDSLYLLLGVQRDSSVVVAAKTGARETSTTIVGKIAVDRGVISLEQVCLDDSTRTLGRARFGYRGPAPLERLAAESLAVSEPVLFRAEAQTPANVDELLPIMHATVNVAAASVGLFWETYNAKPGERVDFRISISSVNRPGLFRRLASALRVISPPSEKVAIAWRDPSETARDTAVSRSSKTIVPRAVRVDLSKLTAGEYFIEVTSTSPQRRPATASRRIRVLSPGNPSR